MLVQLVGDRQLVYVDNYSLDYIKVADEFGMIENGRISSYVEILNEPYVNKNGVSMPSIRLRGRTVDLHVVNNSIRLASCDPEDFVKALNYFPPDSRVTMNDHTFVSKFHSSGRAVYDCANRSFSLRTYGKKDLKGIYGLMTSLGDNNGKLYEPVIARYVYTSYNMPRHRQLVGYFDLGEYMAVIKDPRRSFFPNMSEKTKTLVYVECKPTPPSVRVTNVVDGCAVLDIVGLEGTYDAKKLNDFKPYVIVTRRPLKIKEMKFRWTKVTFDKVDVFLTPIMTLADAWETLEGGLDLLSIPPKNAPKQVFLR